jgi:hypothetical protein
MCEIQRVVVGREGPEHRARGCPAMERLLLLLWAVEDAYEDVVEKHEGGCPTWPAGEECAFCQQYHAATWILSSLRTFGESEMLPPDLSDIYDKWVTARRGDRHAGMRHPPRMVPIDRDLWELADKASGGNPGKWLSSMLRSSLLPAAIIEASGDPVFVCEDAAGG